MRALLLLVLLLAVPAWTEEDDLQYFGPADHAFRVAVPGDVRALENGPQRYLWGSGSGRASYLFGYCELPRAAGMSQSELFSALNQFTTSYLSSAGVKDRSRTPINVRGCPGLEVAGTGRHGAEWTWVLAVGPRVFLASAAGTPEKEARRFWASFVVAP